MIKSGAPKYASFINTPSLLSEENAMNNSTSWHLCFALIDNVDIDLNMYELTAVHPINSSNFKIMNAIAIKDPEEEGSYPKYGRVRIIAPFTIKQCGILEYNTYAGAPLILCSTKYDDIGASNILRTPNPDFKRIRDGGDKGIFNSNSGNGLLLAESGMVSIISSPAGLGPANPRTYWNPNGDDTTAKSSIFDYCNNRHVVIGSENEPVNREHFGIFSTGSAKNPSDFKVCRRSFISKSKDISEGFVSTCEGTDDILWGPNNQTNKISERSSYIFHKVIDAGQTKNRMEIRIGDTKDATSQDFFRMTLMKLGMYEQYKGLDDTLLTTRNTSLTSKFSLRIAADGSFEVWSGNNMVVRGSEQAFKFHLMADKDGNATLKTPKTFEVAAGNSSIKLDAKEGVTIKDSNGHVIKIASTGITVNGRNIIHDAFYDLLKAHAADFCLSPAMGPVGINPIVITEMNTKLAPGVGKLKTNDKAAPEAFVPTEIATNYPEP